MDTRKETKCSKRKLNVNVDDEQYEALKQELSGKSFDLYMSQSKIRKQEKKEEEYKQEIDDLKKDLEKKSFDNELSQIQILKQQQLVKRLKEKLECAVCLDIPRSIPVPVCQNGHFVCKKCKTDSCPTCRTAMGTGTSLLANTVLENINHKCHFQECSLELPLRMIEEHEASCSNRIVKCPHFRCGDEVPLGKLIDHLTDDAFKNCFANKEPVKIYINEWNSLTIEDVLAKDSSWPLHLCEYSGETLAVFPVKSEEGTFYFVVLMFANEDVCAKYTFEMIVHEEGSEALDSQMSVRFRGKPMSIDGEKEDWNLYGANEKLMAKLVKESVDNSSLRLSFRISEIINVV